MPGIKKKNQIKSKPHPKGLPQEFRLPARAVSRGVAIGSAVILGHFDDNPRRVEIPASAVVSEVRRLKKAFDAALRQLDGLAEAGSNGSSANGSAIFEAHRDILADPSFVAEALAVIRRDGVNAEWAVMSVARRLAGLMKRSRNFHLREKAGDIIDVGSRVRRALDEHDGIQIPKDAIIFAREISPSLAVELARQGAAGICAESGGWTSHSFIIAREAGIPAVVGVKGVHRKISDGGTVIVDGFRGEVILNPGEEAVSTYRNVTAESEGRAGSLSGGSRSRTLDGVHVRVRANIDPVRGLSELKSAGVEGIGLFRTETLFEDGKGFPNEAVQKTAYSRILKAAGRSGAVIRTFDLPYDRVFHADPGVERNPSLGLRGTRLMLALEKEFRSQLRALLRASSERRLDILLPMISDVAEVRKVRSLLKDEAAKLRAKGVKPGRIRLGAMIEVPAAVLMAREILAEVDFVNVGTNDLVQYMLGADRDNEMVSGYFRTLHPAVLRAVGQVVEEGRRLGKPVIICGEMAGSPAYVGVLVGLGVTDISVGFNAIPRVRRVISGLAFEECRDVVGHMMACQSATETEEIWQKEFGERLGALVPNLSFRRK